MTEFLKNAVKEKESAVARVAVAKVTDSYDGRVSRFLFIINHPAVQ